MPGRELREELDEILALRSALDDQDALLQEHNVHAAVSESQISIIEALYEDCKEATTGIRLPFRRSDDTTTLRPQIRYARGKIEHKVRKLEREIENFADPVSARGPDVPHELTSADPRKVFVVCGRNEAANSALFHFLRSIDLDPVEWSDAVAMTRTGSPYPGDVLEVAMSRCRAVIAFLTGDDMARLGTRFLKDSDQDHERELTPQCRPNVLFEAGMAFGRYPQRTIVVALAQTRPFTDTLGRHIVYLSKSPQGRHELANRLRTAGCAVKTDNRTNWLTDGDFETANHPPDNVPLKTEHPNPENLGSHLQTDALVRATLSIPSDLPTFNPVCRSITFDSDSTLAIQIDWRHDENMNGLSCTVINKTAVHVDRYRLQIIEARSWSEEHERFRSGPNLPPITIDEGNLPSSTRANWRWLLRMAIEPHGPNLVLGRDHKLLWPNNDPSAIEIWRFTLGISSHQVGVTVPSLPPEIAPAYLFIRWDRGSGDLAMAKPVTN